ncbi:MAG: hypothetical protein D6778_01300, partial [Nitrospirae bacterium]
MQDLKSLGQKIRKLYRRQKGLVFSALLRDLILRSRVPGFQLRPDYPHCKGIKRLTDNVLNCDQVGLLPDGRVIVTEHFKRFLRTGQLEAVSYEGKDPARVAIVLLRRFKELRSRGYPVFLNLEVEMRTLQDLMAWFRTKQRPLRPCRVPQEYADTLAGYFDIGASFDKGNTVELKGTLIPRDFNEMVLKVPGIVIKLSDIDRGVDIFEEIMGEHQPEPPRDIPQRVYPFLNYKKLFYETGRSMRERFIMVCRYDRLLKLALVNPSILRCSFSERQLRLLERFYRAHPVVGRKLTITAGLDIVHQFWFISVVRRFAQDNGMWIIGRVEALD